MAVAIKGPGANFLLDIAMAGLPSGVIMPYDDDMDEVASSLEEVGLIERHHVGRRKGARLTSLGEEVVAGFLMVKAGKA